MTTKFRIYAAGDMKSDWQDRLRKILPPEVFIFDPRTNNSTDPAVYTKWGLDAVKDSNLVVALMGPHNPSGFGMSLECGYAHALGRPIIFIDEMAKDWRGKYFDMLRVISTVVFSVEDAAALVISKVTP